MGGHVVGDFGGKRGAVHLDHPYSQVTGSQYAVLGDCRTAGHQCPEIVTSTHSKRIGKWRSIHSAVSAAVFRA